MMVCEPAGLPGSLSSMTMAQVFSAASACEKVSVPAGWICSLSAACSVSAACSPFARGAGNPAVPSFALSSTSTGKDSSRDSRSRMNCTMPSISASAYSCVKAKTSVRVRSFAPAMRTVMFWGKRAASDGVSP